MLNAASRSGTNCRTGAECILFGGYVVLASGTVLVLGVFIFIFGQ